MEKIFNVSELLGEGSFSEVLLGTYKSDNPNDAKSYAIKYYEKSQLCRKREFRKASHGGMSITTALDKVQQEIEIWKTLSHPNIVQLIEVIEQPEKLFIVMDYYAGGQLLEYSYDTKEFYVKQTGKTMDLDAASKFLHDVVCGLEYLHSKGVIHRDIKPENILYDGVGKYSITDFGVAKQLEKENMSTGFVSGSQGTYAFFSPEICKGITYNGFASDIWALGITLHVAVFGIIPFWSEAAKDLFDTIATEPYELPKQGPENILKNDNICQLLLGMLQNDEAHRFTLETIKSNQLLRMKY